MTMRYILNEQVVEAAADTQWKTCEMVHYLRTTLLQHQAKRWNTGPWLKDQYTVSI
jgi:hypothetical protein